MASPQCEDGYTRIANELLEALCRAKLTLYEWRVLMAIIRFTYGYNRKVDQISVRQLSRITSINYRLVYRALKSLEKKNMIHISKKRNRLILGIQKDYENWDVISPDNVISSDDVISGDNTKSSEEITTGVIPRDNIKSSEEITNQSSKAAEKGNDNKILEHGTALSKDSIKDIYKDNIKDNILFPCADLPAATPAAQAGDQRQGCPQRPPVITIPLIHKKGGRPQEYPVSRELVSELQALYPAVDVMQALREIRAWNLANPRNRKTRNGILRHINTWLKKEQDRAHRSRDDPADVTAGLRKWAARYGIETPGLEEGDVDQD